MTGRCATTTFMVGLNETRLRLTLKCDPDYAEVLREQYAAITPGYYMNKRHWNTVVLDDTVPVDLLHQLIDHSYLLVARSLPKALRAQLNVDNR